MESLEGGLRAQSESVLKLAKLVIFQLSGLHHPATLSYEV